MFLPQEVVYHTTVVLACMDASVTESLSRSQGWHEAQGNPRQSLSRDCLAQSKSWHGARRGEPQRPNGFMARVRTSRIVRWSDWLYGQAWLT